VKREGQWYPPEKANATESGVFCRNLAADTVHFSLADAVSDCHIGVFPRNLLAEVWHAPRVLSARIFAATGIDRTYPA
jgi:hypothetical protein